MNVRKTSAAAVYLFQRYSPLLVVQNNSFNKYYVKSSKAYAIETLESYKALMFSVIPAI